MEEELRKEKNDGLRGGCSALLRIAGRRDPRGAHSFLPGIPSRHWRMATAHRAGLLSVKYEDGGEERVGNVFVGMESRDAGCGIREKLISQPQPRDFESMNKEVDPMSKPQKEEEKKDPTHGIPWYEFWGGDRAEGWFAEERGSGVRRACCGGLHVPEEQCFGSVVDW